MKKRILIIDDEENMRHMMTELLTAHGYEVDSLSDAIQALKKIEAAFYNFIFCDIRMPGMDGMELLARIKQLAPATLVIIITAFGAVDVAVAAIKAGAHDYITKPFSRSDLIQRIESLA